MEPFIGQIMLFAGTYAPRDWAICDGSILPIQQYASLFSIIGTAFGGNGTTTFALPDLRGRVPVGVGTGPGLYNKVLGEKGGTEIVTLNPAQMPSHSHGANLDVSAKIMCDPEPGEEKSPTGAAFAKSAADIYSGETPTAQMNDGALNVTGTVAVEAAGNNSPHANMQPYQAINYCIALVGIYPPRP